MEVIEEIKNSIGMAIVLFVVITLIIYFFLASETGLNIFRGIFP
jgi:hypothetical protein